MKNRETSRVHVHSPKPTLVLTSHHYIDDSVFLLNKLASEYDAKTRHLARYVMPSSCEMMFDNPADISGLSRIVNVITSLLDHAH